MTDMTLTPQDQQELGDAIDHGLAAGGLPGTIKQDFCRYWGAVKKVLEWIQTLPVSQKIKDGCAEIIAWGDFIHARICKNWATDSAPPA